MSFNTDSPGMSYALSILGVQGNPDLPVVDSTRVWGGAWAVSLLSLRNTIPASLRKADVTRCYVTETGLTYVLRGGIDNTNWLPDSPSANVTLEVGDFEPDTSFQVGVNSSLDLLSDLFATVGGRAWSVASVRGLPPGITFVANSGTHGSLVGIPTLAGNFTIVINGVDVDGHRAQYILPVLVAAAAVTVPSTVGSAALNVVMVDSTAECSVILTTLGFTETGQEAFAVANSLRRFVGGNDVGNSLFLGSYGYTSVAGGIGYFSFAFSVSLFRSRYPLATLAEFDVYVHPSGANDPDYVNRVNYGYQLSLGLQKVTLGNGIDFAYASQAGTQGGFWHYDAGTASGQQNTTTNLHQQFTITGLAKKKIGVMSINLLTGMSQFTPIALVGAVNPPPTVANPFGNHTITALGSGSLPVPTTTFSDTDALTWSASSADGSGLPSGLTFDIPTLSYIWSAGLANGNYSLKTTVTDTANQSISDPFVLTINRDTSQSGYSLDSTPGNEPIETGDDGTGQPNLVLNLNQ